MSHISILSNSYSISISVTSSTIFLHLPQKYSHTFYILNRLVNFSTFFPISSSLKFHINCIVYTNCDEHGDTFYHRGKFSFNEIVHTIQSTIEIHALFRFETVSYSVHDENASDVTIELLKGPRVVQGKQEGGAKLK